MSLNHHAGGAQQVETPRSPAAGAFARAARVLWLLPLLLAGFCFWQAVPPAERPGETSATAAVSPPAGVSRPVSSRRQLLTRPIQEIQVGQRVLAENPELAGQDVPQIDIDPDKTRLIVLHQIKPDGHALTMETLWSLDEVFGAILERLSSETARPIERLPIVGTPEEIFLFESLVGHVVELNLPELGAEGPAEVVAVRRCPPIEPDDGSGRRLVTSVFRHSAANVVDITTTGSDEPIGATATHPFWSEDRQAFVPAGELRAGEHLRRADGTHRQVTRITPRRGPPVPVFNFEVDGQHAYSVGVDGLVVHNACPVPTFPSLISHAKKHAIGGKTLIAPKYYQSAVANMRRGTPFRYVHEGQQKIAHVTRLGDDLFRFTATSKNLRRIYTHFETTEQYLNNIGITLPIGF